MLHKLIVDKQYRLAWLILFVSFNEGCKWSEIPFFNVPMLWGLLFIIVLTLLYYRKKTDSIRIIEVYLLWYLICFIRGIFVAENYWDYKCLITGGFAMSLPLFVYAFANERVLHCSLNLWLRYALIPFFFVFILFLPRGAYHFYLGPLLILACCFPYVRERKWRLLVIFVLLLMMCADLSARSQVIKAGLAVVMIFAYYFRHLITDKMLRIVHIMLFVLPIVLLVLGLTGRFNIFSDLSSREGKYMEKKIVDGKVVEEDLSTDTRTFIYEEVIMSALNNDYVVCGRSLARGNDSSFFGSHMAEDLKTGRYERYANEALWPTIFTWSGIIGLILLSLIYLQASYLAVYHSNCILMKLLGVYVAFRWAYGWVEDFYSYSPMIIALWMMIAMCYSSQFRSMTDLQFKVWINSVLRK